MDDDIDDGVPYDGTDPGANFDVNASGSTLSASDRAIAASWRRPASLADEPEAAPLPAIQKIVTTGRELRAGKVHVYEKGLQGLCTTINPSGDTVAVGCQNSHVMLVDIKTCKTMAIHDLSEGRIAAITAIRYRPEVPGGSQNVALLAQEQHILNVHMSTGRVLSSRKEEGNKIAALELRPSGGDLLATAGSDAVVRVYDETRGGAPRATLDHGDDSTTTGHSNRVYSISWVPGHPDLLVSGGWDRTLQVWDLRLERSVRSFFGPYVCGDAVDMRGGVLLTGSWRHANPLQLWDFGSGRLLTNLPFFQPEHEACMLYAAKFGRAPFSDNVILAGGSGKRPCVKVFQSTGEVVGTLPCPSSVNALDTMGWGPRDRVAAVCCDDRLMVVPI